MQTFDSSLGVIEDAQTQYAYRVLVEQHISCLAQQLLQNPQVNVAVVGHDLEGDVAPNPDWPLSDVLEKLAATGLKLFELGTDASKTLTIPADETERFLRTLLKPAASECARLGLLASRRATLAEAAHRTELAHAEDDGTREIPDDFGYLDGAVFDEAPLELDDEESRLHDFERAEQLLAELEGLLASRHPDNGAWQKSLRSFAKRGGNLISEAFAPEPNDSNAMTAEVYEAVNAAFDAHSPEAARHGRFAYAGIIMTLAGLTDGSLDPAQACERARKAVQRAARPPSKFQLSVPVGGMAALEPDSASTGPTETLKDVVAVTSTAAEVSAPPAASS